MELRMLITGFFLSLMILLPKLSSGRIASTDEFPMMAAIFLNNRKFAPCGGVIVGRGAVVTAANCFPLENLKATAKTASVLVGDINLFWTQVSRTRQHIHIRRIIVHPNYKRGQFDHDLAIVETQKRFQFSDHVRPAIIIDQKPKPGDQCYVAGYGRKNFEQSGIRVHLQSIPINISNSKECQSKLAGYNDRLMICGGDISAQDKYCKGDTGGPLVCGEELAGIVTYGMRCVTSNAAGAFIEIRHYERWIKVNLPRSRQLEDPTNFKTIDNGKVGLKGWLYPTFIIQYVWVTG